MHIFKETSQQMITIFSAYFDKNSLQYSQMLVTYTFFFSKSKQFNSIGRRTVHFGFRSHRTGKRSEQKVQFKIIGFLMNFRT